MVMNNNNTNFITFVGARVLFESILSAPSGSLESYSHNIGRKKVYLEAIYLPGKTHFYYLLIIVPNVYSDLLA